MHKLNQLILCNCVDGMADIESDSIPLTVTSPPYDDLRVYSGAPWNSEVFKKIAEQLYRITTQGGVVCWVVQDQVNKTTGGLSGNKFRQALYFQKLGFSISHEIIMVTAGFRSGNNRRYPNQFHTCFVLSKGKIKTINLLCDRRNKYPGTPGRFCRADKNGKRESFPTGHITKKYGIRTNVWRYSVGGAVTQDKFVFAKHSAIMPEKMAADLICSFSNVGDLVFDPMSGVGTTAKMAMLKYRNYLGFEIWEQAHQTAVKRLAIHAKRHTTMIDNMLLACPNSIG